MHKEGKVDWFFNLVCFGYFGLYSPIVYFFAQFDGHKVIGVGYGLLAIMFFIKWIRLDRNKEVWKKVHSTN